MSVLSRLFGSPAAREREARAAALADPIVDRMVAATDKRLAYLKDYRKVLRAPVAAAHASLATAIARIPGPCEVSPRSWGQDETVKALFARAEDTARSYSVDAGMSAWFASHPAGDCMAMLALQQVERRVLASAMRGDTVQAEVARTTVSFTGPQFLAPAADEAGVRAELVARAFEYLALLALERVGAQRMERRELEKERSLLQAQLKLARRHGAGFGAIGGGDAGPGDAARIERELQDNVAELERSASRNLLPELLTQLNDVLEHHDEHVVIEPCTLALDTMNFAVPAGAPGAITPRVAMLRLARRGPFAVLVGRFPRAGLKAHDWVADASKFI